MGDDTLSYRVATVHIEIIAVRHARQSDAYAHEET